MNYIRTPPCKQKPRHSGHKHTYRVFVRRVFIVVRSQFSTQWLQLADVMKEQTLVASWANAAKPSPNRHYVPVCEQKKVNSYISASVQTDKSAGIVCPSRSRGSLRESSSVASQMRLPLWRHRAGAINSARVRFHSGKQGASYVLWAKEEHQPASWTLIFSETQSETRSFNIRRCLKMQLLLWLDMWLHKCQSLSRLAAISDLANLILYNKTLMLSILKCIWIYVTSTVRCAHFISLHPD